MFGVNCFIHETNASPDRSIDRSRPPPSRLLLPPVAMKSRDEDVGGFIERWQIFVEMPVMIGGRGRGGGGTRRVGELWAAREEGIET